MFSNVLGVKLAKHEVEFHIFDSGPQIESNSHYFNYHYNYKETNKVEGTVAMNNFHGID